MRIKRNMIPQQPPPPKGPEKSPQYGSIMSERIAEWQKMQQAMKTKPTQSKQEGMEGMEEVEEEFELGEEGEFQTTTGPYKRLKRKPGRRPRPSFNVGYKFDEDA